MSSSMVSFLCACQWRSAPVWTNDHEVFLEEMGTGRERRRGKRSEGEKRGGEGDERGGGGDVT